MFNGEVNVEKIDKWIRQLEVYFRIQNFHDDDTKIQLASLRTEGATLVWWESKTKEEIKKHGKIILSWYDFITAIKQKFYPFRRRYLLLGVYLQSPDTLLNYIGDLHSYLRHIILMFNPTSLDEVCVQATHLESRGENTFEEGRQAF